MNDPDLYHNLKKLGAVPVVRLPRHQSALKRRLLNQHARQQAVSFRFADSFKQVTTGVLSMMKRKSSLFGSLGAAMLVVGVVGFTILSDKPVSALDLAKKAADKAQQMVPVEIEAKNRKYQQSLKDRLTEAQNAPGLRIIDKAELAAWGIDAEREDPLAVHFITYNDAQNHRVVIGVNAEGEPVLVHDIEALQEAKKPDMTVNEPSSAVPEQGQSATPGEEGRR